MTDCDAEEREDGHEFLGVEWEVEVRDKDGNLTDHKKGKNSLLVGMASMLFQGFEYIGSYYQAKDYTGTLRTPNWGGTSGRGPYINAAAGDATYGIVVGSNNTPVTADDYKLNTPIANGIGAGQLQYLATTVNAVVNASPRSSFRTDRTFTNNSGGGVTVRELGIYAVGSFIICVCRDVIPDTPIANGSSLFVKYTIYITI